MNKNKSKLKIEQNNPPNTKPKIKKDIIEAKNLNSIISNSSSKLRN